jgi:hypothetical protein
VRAASDRVLDECAPAGQARCVAEERAGEPRLQPGSEDVIPRLFESGLEQAHVAKVDFEELRPGHRVQRQVRDRVLARAAISQFDRE